MIEVVPFIKTLGTEKFKNFLNSPFHFELNLSDTFDGWKQNYPIFECVINECKISLQSDSYILYVEDIKKAEIPKPKTINDFINDMLRYDIKLYWVEEIDEKFEPKDYLDENSISSYYSDLLRSMDKSHELQIEGEDGNV